MARLFDVNLDATLHEMLRSNVSLSAQPLVQSGSPGRFLNWPCPFPFCHSRGGKNILRNLLLDSRNFENPLFFLLFKAFAYGEYRFVRDFVPQNSHEERLTGHLISELAGALAVVERRFALEAKHLYGEAKRLEFYYADMSANRMETQTGADFALVLHVNLPDYEEYIRAVVCQAKKLGSCARIETDQLDRLIAWADEGAYYCFYDMDRNGRCAPLMAEADRVKGALDRGRNRPSLDRQNIIERGPSGPCVPLSVFLVFRLLNMTLDVGKSFTNLRSATKYMVEGPGRNGPGASRILLVSLGGPSPHQDITSLAGLFPFRPYEEE